MKNINKKIGLTIGAILVLGLIWLLWDGFSWTSRSTIKGRLLYLVDASGQRNDEWALTNGPFSWGLTVKVDGVSSELKNEGTTIECRVVSMDTSEGNPGIDGYAVVDNCKSK